MTDHPVPAVGVCILRAGMEGPEILLIRRVNPPHQGAWSLPGGRQHFGERAEEAARREILEETGLTVGGLTLIAAIDIIEGGYHYVVLDYAALWDEGCARAGDDAAACSWCSIAHLADRPVTEAIIAVAVSAAEKLGLRPS